MDLSSLPKLETFSQHTTVYIDPDQLDKWWKAFTPVFKETSAAPECVYLEVFEDPAVPGKITWVANWNASPDWVFTEHIKKPYYAPYLQAVEPLFTKPRELRILKREPFLSGKKANFEPVIGEGNEGISFHVTVEIQPESDEDFRKEWKKIFGPVAGEPECLYFEVYTDPTTPPGAAIKHSWMENWSKPFDWLMGVQVAKDYYKPYLEATVPMFAGERHYAPLKRKEGFISWKEGNFEGAKYGDLRT